MNQNFYSAFARVSDGSGENVNQQHGNVAQYGQLGAFPMHQMPMFPTATLANNSSNHHQTASSSGESQHQRNNQQAGAASSWIQQTPPSGGSISAAQLQRTLVQTSGANSNHISGTPLGEWTGQEWIPPQHSTIAALAGGTAVQTVVPTSYTMLGGVNWSEPTTSQQPTTNAATTTATVPSTQTQSVHFTELQVPPKQKSRKSRKSSAAPVQNTTQQQQQQQPRTGNHSDDDMLNPEQLAKVAMSKSRQIRPTYSTPVQPTAAPSQQPENHTPAHSNVTHPIIQYNRPEPPPRPQRDPKPFDGRYAICPNCGTQSANYLDCESCNHMLPDDVKMYDPEAAKIAETARKEELKKQATEKLLLHKLKLEKEKRLKMAAEAAAKPQTRSSRASTSGSPSKASTSFSRRVSSQPADDDWTAPVRSRRRGGGPKRSRQAEVYVLSSHSSDEDSEDEVYVPPPSRRAPGSSTSPAAGTVSTRSTRTSQQTQRPDFTQVPELYVRCVKITMGTLTGTPREPLHIALTGVDIHIETETETVKIRLDNRDIKECLGCVQKNLSVLFIRANRIFGEKVRGALQMVEPVEGNERYYDPESPDARYKYIIVHLDTQHTINNLAHRLNDVFRAISLSYQAGGVLFRFIELSKAQRLLGLIRGENDSADVSSSQILDDIVRSMDDDSEEQRAVPQFSGPVKKLFAFPFPPARGLWIDNQDRFCLTEGEFLNDNIISFYLNYLYEKVLTPVQRERTYIFSTFFYTKLSQRVSNQGLKDAAKKTAAEKRHWRVKTWTKNVDIFDKDFIIVPINEASHWFLAIICYPGLQATEYYPEQSAAEPERVNVQEPVVNNREGISSTTAEVNGEASGPSGDGGQQVADGQLDLDSDDEFFGGFEYEEEEVQPDSQNAGHKVKKRPCILIFDSLMMPPGQNIAIKRLREYLGCEWAVKHPNESRSFTRELFPGSNSKSPQQDNYSDCGIYLLQYVESFFKNPIQDYSLPMTWTVDWFEHSIIKNKRGQIRSLIDSLKVEYDELHPPQPKRARTRSKKQSSPTKSVSPPKKTRVSPPAKKVPEVTKETSVPEALGLASNKVPLSVSLDKIESSTSKSGNDDMDAPTDTELEKTDPVGDDPESGEKSATAGAVNPVEETASKLKNKSPGDAVGPVAEISAERLTNSSLENGGTTPGVSSEELSGGNNRSFSLMEEDNSQTLNGTREENSEQSTVAMEAQSETDTALEDNSKMAVELENIENSVEMGSGDGTSMQPMQTE